MVDAALSVSTLLLLFQLLLLNTDMCWAVWRYMGTFPCEAYVIAVAGNAQQLASIPVSPFSSGLPASVLRGMTVCEIFAQPCR
jgi:NaMN:DMB phosphoribosyltransferase